MSKIEDVLNEREKTHGDFKYHALYTQLLKVTCREATGWSRLSDAQKESIEMILHKIGRVLAGDPNIRDHWTDIAGYATLIEKELK